jgi:hypothetical protein
MDEFAALLSDSQENIFLGKPGVLLLLSQCSEEKLKLPIIIYNG